MKKKISVLLSVLLILTMPCVAQLSAAALPSGTTIYLNAYEAGWENAYIYGWNYGLQGEFIQMEKEDYEGVFSFTLPQSSADGSQYFYFTNKNAWDGQEQTVPLGTIADKNFYTLYSRDETGKWTGMWSHIVPAPTNPTQPPTDPNIILAGTQILFDNTNTQWADIYLYGWKYGFNGEFRKMQKIGASDLYAYTLPQDVPVEEEFCVFVNKDNWENAQQTVNVAYESSDKNTVCPNTGATPFEYAWRSNTPPVSAPYVSATPSKSFTTSLNVGLYTNCYESKYSIDGGPLISYADGTNLPISVTTSLTLKGYDRLGIEVVSASYTYTKVGLTTITATVTGYSGDVYAYLFGGDRLGGDFHLMTKRYDGSYTYSFSGAAQVIFTTTNSWNTARKLNTDEPYVAAGSTVSFELSAPPTENWIPKGTAIMYDNMATEWTDVYIYGWKYGFYGEFLPMTQIEGTNLYYYILPEDVKLGEEFCLFVNSNSWPGATQTKNIVFTTNTVNTVIPSGTGSPLNYTWAYNTPPVVNYVSATPSKSFAETLDIVLYTNCDSATYSLNGGAAIAYTDGSSIMLSETSTVTLNGYDDLGEQVATETYTYIKVGMTTVTATVTGYDGPVYAYLFGGDRIGGEFYLMRQETGTGTYSYQFEGAAQVIFTTTNEWATAVKLLPSGEPLLEAGSTTSFMLTYPAY